MSGWSVSSSRYSVEPSAYTASVVQINRQLVIPDRKARVYIQNGEQITKRKIDKFKPYCSLLMQDLHKAGEPKLTVSPGQFEVIKFRKYDDAYFPGSFGSLGGWTKDPPTNAIFEIEMRLNSAEQPGVRALICARHASTYGLHHPTLAEIRITLGDAIEIKTQ
jgi:hypothetical protein